MRATLVVNESAGEGDHDLDRVAGSLRRRGCRIDVIPRPQMKEGGLDEPGDVVVVLGGDGTVAKVARELAGKGVPVHILPGGTSNNIAQSLGIRRKSLHLEQVLATWRVQRMDAIELDGELVIEAAGCGAFAEMMQRESARADRKGPHHEARALGDDLEVIRPFPYRVEMDGKTIEGEALLVELMVISQVGPRLKLAPRADPSDGLLDLVIAGEDQREPLQRYFGSRRRPPKLPTFRGESFAIAGESVWHVDDDLVPGSRKVMKVRRDAWQVLVPPQASAE